MSSGGVSSKEGGEWAEEGDVFPCEGPIRFYKVRKKNFEGTG